ncbi:MAG: NUDIX hydrolase [Xanthomonadaceae bacterium]|nr:NUDIX hydrolase [Xanthomonadaceae bacterium]
MGARHHITVACVVQRNGRFLFVEESVGGRRVLNQPSGHWEDGETLIDGAIREALEETGWDVRPTALLGIYEYEPPALGYGFLRFAFLADALRHHPERPLDDGIAAAVWLTPDELRAATDRHRSPMVQRAVDDALAGRSLPLSTIAHLVD